MARKEVREVTPEARMVRYGAQEAAAVTKAVCVHTERRGWGRPRLLEAASESLRSS